MTKIRGILRTEREKSCRAAENQGRHLAWVHQHSGGDTDSSAGPSQGRTAHLGAPDGPAHVRLPADGPPAWPAVHGRIPQAQAR